MIGRKATRVRPGTCMSALARVVGIVSLTGPKAVKEGIEKAEAEKLKEQIEAVGGGAEVK